MATFAARRLLEMADNTAGVLAIELLAACQGIDFRAPLKAAMPDIDDRRRFWEEMLSGSLSELVFAGRDAEARELLQQAVDRGTRCRHLQQFQLFVVEIILERINHLWQRVTADNGLSYRRAEFDELRFAVQQTGAFSNVVVTFDRRHMGRRCVPRRRRRLQRLIANTMQTLFVVEAGRTADRQLQRLFPRDQRIIGDVHIAFGRQLDANTEQVTGCRGRLQQNLRRIRRGDQSEWCGGGGSERGGGDKSASIEHGIPSRGEQVFWSASEAKTSATRRWPKIDQSRGPIPDRCEP